MKLKSNVKRVIYLTILILTFLLMIFGYIFKYNNPVITPENTLKKAVGVVNGDCTISQKFEVKVDSLNSIDITYIDFQKQYTNGTMLVEIFNDEKEIIYRNLYNIIDLQEYDNMNFIFKPIKNVKEKIFELRISFDDMDSEKNMTFYAADEASSYKIEQINDDNLDIYSTIDIVQHGISKGYFYMFIFYALFLIEVLYGSYKYIKMKPMGTKRLIIGSIVSVLLSCIMAFSLMKLFYNIVFLDKIGWFCFPVLLITSTIEMIIIGSTIANKKGRVSNLFLALAIPLGALYFICMVPGSVPDEGFHAVMTYEIISGQISQKDVTYVKELEAQYFKLDTVVKSLKDNTKTEVKFRQNGGYWLFMYITGALGMFIGKICGLSVLGFMYCGCFVNYIVFLLVGYFAIEKLPFGKYVALVYMLSPIYLQQATSLSCDALINVASLLLLSLIMNVKFREEELKSSEMIFIFILCGYLSLCKMAYFPAFILLFLIKDKLLKYIKEHKKNIILTLSFVVLFVIATKIIMGSTASSNYIDLENDTIDNVQGDINKFQYFFTNPFLNSSYLIMNTLYNYTDDYIVGFLGKSLNWFTVNGPVYLSIILIFDLIVSALFDKNKSNFSKKDKLSIVLFWIINTIVIFSGIYFGTSPINQLIVQGIQGRYFLPTTLVLFLLLCTSKVKINNIKNKNLFIAISLLFVNIYMISLVIQFYL